LAGYNFIAGMYPLRVLFLLHLFFILHLQQLTAQCSLAEISLDKKIENAELIVEGKVIEKRSFFNDEHTFIYTSNKILVYKYLKGAPVAKTIYVITEGGVVGDKNLSVSPAAKLDIGNVGLFMVVASAVKFSGNDVETYSIYGGIQGFIRYDLKDKTAYTPFKKYTDVDSELYKVIMNKTGTPFDTVIPFDINSVLLSLNLRTPPAVISSFSPTVTSAGTYSVITIQGSGFGTERGSSTVNFKDTDDGGQTYIQAFPDQYLSWSDTQIKVQVPSKAGTGPIQVDVGTITTSTDTLLVSYSELNASTDSIAEYETNIVGLNYEGGITWNMNTHVDADTAVKHSFIRALSTWKCNTFINWKLGSTTAVRQALNDDINVVAFDEKKTLPEGTLAVCYSYWGGCQSSEWVLVEMDVLINSAAPWEYGPALPSNSSFDFQSVILHELGHGHQLGHVIDESNLMHYSIGYGDVKRTLRATNIAAGNDVLSRSTAYNHCNFPIVKLLAPGSCEELYIGNQDNDFLIFPNPSSGFFNIAIPDKKQNLKIHIYSSVGDLLTTVTTSESSSYVSFDLSEYSNGVYFFMINNGEKTVTRKFILMK
jgi:hypothetical protein